MEHLSPFPFIVDNKRYEGILFEWPERCSKCQHFTCSNPVDNEISLCSYGFNYQRIADSFVIAGFIVMNSTRSSEARTKNMRSHKKWIVNNDQVYHAVNMLQTLSLSESKVIFDCKQEVIRDYIKKEQYKFDFLNSVRDEINKGLSFVHDYKQINAQIAQNINVIIETNHKGDTIEAKLDSATHPEKAIYWASKFLTEKLNVARFLLHPDWITKESEFSNFRFHGLFIKYLRIYQYMYEKKNIHVSVTGKSYNNIYGNPEAIGVIIHTFLDNALKYSRSNTNVNIHVSDEENGVFFSVSSYGPYIKPIERENIFQPFYRGVEAQRMQEEGAGYGLYIAQMVAVECRSRITVEQEANQKPNAGYHTTFSVNIPYS